ncbi:fatty acyl-CoA hydrolase precursor, medium chain-like [Anneissia japonica]|uniref:fatty acyl-CoA hydrolase precursor, medium chain-like n=1 Tax=Anneissia japonica TaxID=1529436 RepID=UPI001425B697|nr:fatty acyl-CoA hydrolase precursor, medium chain-like [Anneissia japonica]
MFYFSFIIVILTLTWCSCDESPVVEMGYVSMKGKVFHAAESTKPVYAFLGVPYASPPVGDQRFSYPKRLPPMYGEFDATNYPPLCPQNVDVLANAFSSYHFPRMDTDEDCLYLNIYTPTLDRKAELAVMVWIHGGAFMNGGASAYDGSAYATYQNVVFVAMNYRLGALGFLSTEDVNAPGNYGLLDQNIALRWIKSNIKYFGGDQSKVTIVGESSGAMSVGFHFLSRHSRGVFERGIMESGLANCPLAYSKNPKKWAAVLAEELGCASETTKQQIECLLEKPAEEIVYAKLDAPDKPIMVFTPVVDKYFLVDDPIVLVSKGMLHRNDILLGVNNHEGGFSLLKTRVAPDLTSQFSADMFQQVLLGMISGVMPGDNQDTVKKIAETYLGNEEDDFKAFMQLTEVIGDSFFLTPAVMFANAHNAVGGTSFFYEFQHRPSFAASPEWVRADHGDEEKFVIGFPLMNQDEQIHINYTSEEVELTHTMMTYWANFAKYGDPNGIEPKVISMAPDWSPYNPDEGNFMKLDVTPELAQHLKEDKVKFWMELFAALLPPSTNRDEL